LLSLVALGEIDDMLEVSSRVLWWIYELLCKCKSFRNYLNCGRSTSPYFWRTILIQESYSNRNYRAICWHLEFGLKNPDPVPARTQRHKIKLNVYCLQGLRLGYNLISYCPLTRKQKQVAKRETDFDILFGAVIVCCHHSSEVGTTQLK